MSIREKRRTAQVNLRLTPEELTAIRNAATALDVTVTELMVGATLDKINSQDGSQFKGTLRRLLQEHGS